MLVLTPQALIARQGHHRYVTPRTLEDALHWIGRQQPGWIAASQPEPADYVRPMVLVRHDHPLAPLFRYFQASPCPVPRGLVEAHAKSRLEEPDTGVVLGRHGLLMVSMHGATVDLAATNPDLAEIVNRLRYRTPRRGQLVTKLVQAALGLPARPRRVTRQRREAAAVVFDNYGVNPGDLFAPRRVARLQSWWLVPDAARQQPTGAPRHG